MQQTEHRITIVFNESFERDLINAVKLAAGNNVSYADWMMSEVIRRGAVVGDRTTTYLAGANYTGQYANVPQEMGTRKAAVLLMTPDQYLTVNTFKDGVHPHCTYRDMALIFLLDGGVPIADTDQARRRAFAYGLELAEYMEERRPA